MLGLVGGALGDTSAFFITAYFFKETGHAGGENPNQSRSSETSGYPSLDLLLDIYAFG